VIVETEAAQPVTPWATRADPGQDHTRALCEAAVTLATTGKADAIVAVTRAGTTARTLSSLRPRAPIFAATPDDSAARRLSLLWGVTPIVGSIDEDVSALAAALERRILSRALLPPGSTVVVVSVDPDLARPGVNFLKLSRIG
jgi:pyruvate kinase